MNPSPPQRILAIVTACSLLLPGPAHALRPEPPAEIPSTESGLEEKLADASLKPFPPPVFFAENSPIKDHLLPQAFTRINRHQALWVKLRREALPDIHAKVLARGDRRMRVFIGGASTGEELAQSYHEIASWLEEQGEQVASDPEDPDLIQIELLGLEKDPEITAEGRQRLQGDSPFVWWHSDRNNATERDYAVSAISTLNRHLPASRNGLHYLNGDLVDVLQRGAVLPGMPFLPGQADLVLLNNVQMYLTHELYTPNAEYPGPVAKLLRNAWVAGTEDRKFASLTAYFVNRPTSSTGPQWYPAIQRLVDQGKSFLPIRLSEEGCVYLMLESGLRKGLSEGRFLEDGQEADSLFYVTQDRENVMGMYSHFMNGRKGDGKRYDDAALLIIPARAFNKAQKAGRAAVENPVIGGMWLLFAGPLPQEWVHRIVVHPDTKAALSNLQDTRIQTCPKGLSLSEWLQQGGITDAYALPYDENMPAPHPGSHSPSGLEEGWAGRIRNAAARWEEEGLLFSADAFAQPFKNDLLGGNVNPALLERRRKCVTAVSLLMATLAEPSSSVVRSAVQPSLESRNTKYVNLYYPMEGRTVHARLYSRNDPRAPLLRVHFHTLSRSGRTYLGQLRMGADRWRDASIPLLHVDLVDQPQQPTPWASHLDILGAFKPPAASSKKTALHRFRHFQREFMKRIEALPLKTDSGLEERPYVVKDLLLDPTHAPEAQLPVSRIRIAAHGSLLGVLQEEFRPLVRVDWSVIPEDIAKASDMLSRYSIKDEVDPQGAWRIAFVDEDTIPRSKLRQILPPNRVPVFVMTRLNADRLTPAAAAEILKLNLEEDGIYFVELDPRGDDLYLSIYV